MSDLVITFSLVSLFLSIGVLWFVAEMTRRMMANNKRYIDERFTSIIADMREIEEGYQKIGRELTRDLEAVKQGQRKSAGKEQAITNSLKEVARQIHSLDSLNKKATGTRG